MKSFLMIFIAIAMLLTGCKKETKPLTISEIPFLTKSLVHICNPPPSEISATTYYIFNVDTSASQETHDPGGQLRFSPIFHFLVNSKHTPEDRFSLLMFNDTVDERYADFQSQGTFYSRLSALWSAHQWEDKGYSNMLATLQKVRTLLEDYARDQKYQYYKKAIKIQVFLSSDGYPLVETGPQEKQELINATKAIIDFVKQPQNAEIFSEVKIHTIYYWGNPLSGAQSIPEDPDARDLMKSIAEIPGNEGQFMEFGDLQNGELVDLSLFQSPKALLRKELVSFSLIPKNITWDSQSKTMRMDSDGDGISNRDEIDIHKSNPYSPDTDQDGVNDYVQLKTLGQVCTDGDCSSPSHSVNPLCAAFAQDDGTFSDIDFDGLNDCEETLIESNRKSPDSNQNYVLDDYEYRMGLNIVQPNHLLYDNDGDGISDREELRKFLPYKINNEEISVPGFLPMEYHIKEITIDGVDQRCYEITIENIPGIGVDNNLVVRAIYQDPFISNVLHVYQAGASYRRNENIFIPYDQFKNIKVKQEEDN